MVLQLVLTQESPLLILGVVPGACVVGVHVAYEFGRVTNGGAGLCPPYVKLFFPAVVVRFGV